MKTFRTCLVALALVAGCESDPTAPPPTPSPDVPVAADVTSSDTALTPDATPADVSPPPDDVTTTDAPTPPGDAVECDGGLSRCGDGCIDPTSDSSNCGACGNACPSGQACIAGTCTVVAACATGESRCGSACVNTTSNAAHCGGCGRACASGETCVAGACQSMMMACAAGETRCGSACANTMTDAMNCGGCGRACASGQTCAAGTCAGTATCATGETRCGSACANTMTDPAHCGACGHACATGQTCAAGACVAARPSCAVDQTDCAPASPTPVCVNTMTDSRNCGACAAPCPTGSVCTGGACRCGSGGTLCERSCVDTSRDAAHCGRCGNACPAGQTCTAGVCGCASGSTLCGALCVDTRSDSRNCGACGRACPGGQSCVAGACACAAGRTFCGSGFLGRCADLMSDGSNCGACGTLCTGGQSCIAGRCACPTGQTLCGTTCVDTQTSATNCGRCGNGCASGTSCSAGMCRGTPPANDTLAGATRIAVGALSQTITADTTSARNDTAGPCGCSRGNDVYFRLDLSEPGVVYADTFGTAWDTELFIQDSLGANLTGALASAPNVTCNDNNANAGFCPPFGATGAQSQVAAWLPAGRYYLVLSGCGAGVATIHFQFLRGGSRAGGTLTPDGVAHSLIGSTAGTSIVNGACCTTGPESAYFWISCPGSPARTFYASSCDPTSGVNLSTGLNVSLSYYSGLRPLSDGVCNDDTGFSCGNGSSLTATAPATDAMSGAINLLLVDSCATAGGPYSLRYNIGSCASGLLCDSACVATDTDERHCGGCNRRCAADQTCVAGVCRSGVIIGLPGETRFNAISITSPSVTLPVDTTSYRPDTTGTCSCATGKDVFYQFTLTEPSIVYADTVGSTFDTSLFFQDAMGNNLTASNLTNGAVCNDDNGLAGCDTGARSQVMARLEPGPYLLVLSGCGAGGNAVVRFQRIAVGNGPARYLEPGNTVISGTTSGTGRIASACCSTGPEDTYYWYTCPSTFARGFTASTCDRAMWNTSLTQVSPGRATPSACNDDVGGLCAQRSTLLSTTPAGAGIHALYVDGCGSSGASGEYSVSVSR